jgi:hypothetical protein
MFLVMSLNRILSRYGSGPKEVTVAQEQRSPEQLRELAEKVVKLILEDEELTEELGSGLVIARQKCPKGHECDAQFKCSLPFKCPHGHDIVKSVS